MAKERFTANKPEVKSESGVVYTQNQRIKKEKDIRKIKHPAEQQFARLMLKKNPHMILVYEPQLFEYQPPEDTPKRGTLPDFMIINPRNSNKPVYVEITCAEKTVNGVDFKARQKEVMRNASPDTRYVVLYKENLTKMQRKNNDFKPFPWMEEAA